MEVLSSFTYTKAERTKSILASIGLGAIGCGSFYLYSINFKLLFLLAAIGFVGWSVYEIIGAFRYRLVLSDAAIELQKVWKTRIAYDQVTAIRMTRPWRLIVEANWRRIELNSQTPRREEVFRALGQRMRGQRNTIFYGNTDYLKRYFDIGAPDS